MTIAELVAEAYETAKAKGWHDDIRQPLEVLALIHSEISEAAEEVRDGREHPVYQKAFMDPSAVIPVTHTKLWDTATKPEGILIELSDAIIRIADYCGHQGWDLEQALKIKMAYNKTRSYRHGGKKA